MPASLGAHTKASATATSVTTAGVTTTTGSTVVLMGGWGAQVFTSFTDSKSNVWTQIGAELGTSPKTRMYYAQNITGGAGHTFTLTTATAASLSLYMVEILGVPTTGVLDQQNSQIDTVTPFDSPGVTTLQADEFLVGFISSDAGGNPNTHTAGAGFTLLDEVTDSVNFWTGASAYKIVAATGTYNSDFTESGAPTTTRVWIATFKASLAGFLSPKLFLTLGVGV